MKFLILLFLFFGLYCFWGQSDYGYHHRLRVYQMQLDRPSKKVRDFQWNKLDEKIKRQIAYVSRSRKSLRTITIDSGKSFQSTYAEKKKVDVIPVE